jgi:Bacterial regulatory proteins, gntR family
MYALLTLIDNYSRPAMSTAGAFVGVGPGRPDHADNHDAVTELQDLRLAEVLQLQRSGPVPLYYQLACSMEAAIGSGMIGSGTRLPTEKDTASQLVLSTNTVRQAWAYLENRGVLKRVKRSGTFVI